MSWNIGGNRNVFLKLRTKLGLYHVLLTPLEQTSRKVHLTIVEMQQLPEVGNFDSENEISCLRWIIYNGRRKICVFCKSDTDYVELTVYRYRNNMYMNDSDIEVKATEYNTVLQKKNYLLSYLETFSKKLSWWRRHLITIDIILLGDGHFLCCCCYSIYLGIRHEGEGVRGGAPPESKWVANGVSGMAAPAARSHWALSWQLSTKLGYFLS